MRTRVKLSVYWVDRTSGGGAASQAVKQQRGTETY